MAGSGYGKFKRGARVSSFNGIRRGTILLSLSPRFGNARNVVKVTNRNPHNTGDLIYGRFVNPYRPKEERLSTDREFAIWDFELKHERFYKPRK